MTLQSTMCRCSIPHPLLSLHPVHSPHLPSYCQMNVLNAAEAWFFHPITLVWGTAIYTSSIDISTQYLELKLHLKKSNKSKSKGVILADEDASSTLSRRSLSSSKSKEEEEPESFWSQHWDKIRTGRMALVGRPLRLR